MSDEQPVVFAACKRGHDQLTHGQNCDSKQAIRLSKEGSSYVQLRCAKCKFTWTVSVGGAMNI